MPILPRGPFYQRRRPTRLGRALNRTWAFVYSLGVLPSSLVALETRGHKTGRRCTNAVVLADHEGERYLVSMLGERADWVRNVRASGEATLRRRSRRRVRLEEVPVEQRAPILLAYYRRASGARPHFDVSAQPGLVAFARVAPRHPVFRIIEEP